jgi:hypothetical protein
MKKFVVIYHAPESAAKKMEDASPEEMKKGMEPWMAWVKKCGPGLVDLGAPLGTGQKVTKTGSAPSTRNVVGYSILQAQSMEKAKEMLKGHPHLEWAGSCEIEIHEVLPLPG